MIEHSPVYVLKHFFPLDLVYVVHSYLPRPIKKKPERVSPSLQKELQRIQSIELKGKSAMYMKGLDDFVLD